jgi:hypothetical protein
MSDAQDPVDAFIQEYVDRGEIVATEDFDEHGNRYFRPTEAGREAARKRREGS